MREQKSFFQNLDWFTIFLYLIMVTAGWFNIYAAVYNEDHKSIFDLGQNYGKQAIWIGTSLLIALIALAIDGKFYAAFAYPIYGLLILVLVAVLFFGKDIKDTRAWFEIGSFRLQPSEFAKFATNLALAKFLSTMNISMKSDKTKLTAAFILLLPAGLILLQNDTGSALVFSTFVFVLYREGLSGNYLLIGVVLATLFVLTLLISKTILISVLAGIILLYLVLVRFRRRNLLIPIAGFILSVGVIFSVDFAFEHILEPHQKKRINVLLGKEQDPKGAGYNVNQSMIAIGSGGLTGKGFLNGTQTKFDFVPEQSTDFIFCTVGEEWGFLGAFVVIGLFVLLFSRIIYLAERQRSQFTRIYGYGVACILFFHLLVNIGMTIGLVPVIGIPLPFFSYGGSSLWSFTILLFIFLRLDAYRLFILR